MKVTTSESKTFFYFLLMFAGIISYWLLEVYLSTIVFAIVVVVMFKPGYDRFFKWFRGRQTLATMMTFLLVFLTLFIPIILIINITVSQVSQFQQEISTLVSGKNVSLSVMIGEVNKILVKIPYAQDYQLTEGKIINTIQEIVEPVAKFLGNKALAIGSSSAEWVTKFIIFISIIAVLLPKYPQFIQLLKDLSPLDDKLDQKYIDRMTAMTKSMVRGVFIIAFVQGLVTGLLLWIAGLDYLMFLTLLAVFISILPMGAQILAIPIGLVMLILGKIWQGIFLLAGSVLIVGNIDNILRPKLIPKETELNPALILLSAFGGLNLFGFLGIIYGPVTMIFLVTTIEIYLEHYRVEENQLRGSPKKSVTKKKKQV